MITKNNAMTAKNFEHVRLKNSNGEPVRCRTMGKCKIWKTRPDDFKLPVKHGLYDSFYLSPYNAHEWVAVS